jgi:hypothetical protein
VALFRGRLWKLGEAGGAELAAGVATRYLGFDPDLCVAAVFSSR